MAPRLMTSSAFLPCKSSSKRRIYHVNNMRFGFNAIGRRKWPNTIVDKGQMAVKKLMRQNGGATVAR